MKKIIVVGVTGSGKSTLAKKLSEKLNIPYIQLDFLFWKANWQESSDEEFFQKISNVVNQDTWIIDGNYNRTNHLTWKDADTIIWINLPFWLTLYQNVTRSFKRAITQEELWAGTGNRESFRKMFSKESIVLWLLKTFVQQNNRYELRLNDPNYSHIKFYRLKSRREIAQFLNQL